METTIKPNEWKDSLWLQVCWICGFNPAFMFGRHLEVHHIDRRSHATTRANHPCNYFLTCNVDHVGKLATMPHAKQLAYKYLHDEGDFDLDAWLLLRDPDLRAPGRVTMQEVYQELELIRG